MEKVELEKRLKSIPLFANLKEGELREIAKIGIVKGYPAGAHVFFENEIGDVLYIVISGSIKIFRSSEEGRIITLAILRENDFFGEMAIIDGGPHSATAKTLEDSNIMLIHKADFTHTIRKNPEIAEVLLVTLSRRLRGADKQIEDLTFKGNYGKTASMLVTLSERYGVNTAEGTLIDMKLTHQELADLVGVARETVTRILNDFKKDGCITVKSRSIIITNVNELKTWT